jgi:hypothetical protein
VNAPTGGRPARRAPRLGPHERIAKRITRLGRFRKIDPRRGRPLPSLPSLVAVVGWTVLLEESFRRAIAAARAAGRSPSAVRDSEHAAG